MNTKCSLIVLLLTFSFSYNEAKSQGTKYTKKVTTTTITDDGNESSEEAFTVYIDKDYVFPNSSNINKINAQLAPSQQLVLPRNATNPPVPVSLVPAPGYTIRYNPGKKSYEEVKEIIIKKTKTTETTQEETIKEETLN